jgi:hypothetical protein
LSLEDRKVVVRARQLERFLTQPFFATEQFSGLPGKMVALEDALEGCERILQDEFKAYPEQSFYMIGRWFCWAIFGTLMPVTAPSAWGGSWTRRWARSLSAV